jgi:hypothetical protein
MDSISLANALRPRRDRFGRIILAVTSLATAAVIAGMCLSAPSPAAAQATSCQQDLEKFGSRRVAAMEDLSRLAKAGKGKLDPIAACPKLRNLAALEAQFVDYLVKNKDWCGIPDNIVQAMSGSHVKTSKFATQACTIAAQAKKAQQQQVAAPQAQPLPTGPL